MTNPLTDLLLQLREIGVIEGQIEVEEADEDREPAPKPPYAWTPAYPGEEPPF